MAGYPEHPGEAPAVVRLGPRLTPVTIAHARRPELVFMLWETLASWTASPRARDRARRTGEVVDRHRVRASGPVPGGRPDQYADYVLIVSRYGNMTGQWWMKPERPVSPYPRTKS